jgi:hypothetical protein
VLSPFYITEGTPYRPEMILWLELPEDYVVFFQLSGPGEEPASFGESLLQAMKSPMIGPPRRPRIIRVADAHLAAEVQQLLPEVRVIEAPTPELDHVLERMSETALEDTGGEEPSYFEEGRVPADAIEALFRTAKVLYKIAPWKVAGDSQILRVDIPAYGVEGACLSIIGALGQSIGLILFPSIQGFERFLEAAEAPRPPGKAIDLGTTALSLKYEAGSDLPAGMYREALAHGWPVAEAKAYPVVQHRDRDGVSRPLSENDVRIVSVCADSLAAFFVKHRHLFERDALDEPVCESYFDEDDIEVRFTLPYEAGEVFKVNQPRHQPKVAAGRAPATGTEVYAKAERVGSTNTGKIGRNEPCPCGSGKKYKRCCLAEEQLAPADVIDPSTLPDTGDAPATVHDLDRKLVASMDRYARDTFGPNWIVRAAETFRDPTSPDPLLGPWALWNHLFDGKSIAQWFFEDRGDQLSEIERTWLNAQRAAWLSVWEVLEVEPGRSIAVRDLFTGETRVVRETSASESLAKRDVLLARVVDHQGISVLCGLYSRSLAPEEADTVVRRIRLRLRRKSSIPIDRMREERVGRYLIACWEEALEDRAVRAGVPPVLQNTDGDALLITVDHFAFDSADREEIRRRLAAAKEVEDPPRPAVPPVGGVPPKGAVPPVGGVPPRSAVPPAGDDPDPAYVFCKPGNRMHRGWENTVVGRATISGNKLRMESNSVQRADSLRMRVETLLGPLVRHRAREHADPVASLREERGAAGIASPAPGDSTEEMDQIIREMKAKHYADWADRPLPGLGGRTPRAAVRTKSGRQQVDLLLRQNENLESRQPEGQRFDFGGIRRELGLRD